MLSDAAGFHVADWASIQVNAGFIQIQKPVLLQDFVGELEIFAFGYAGNPVFARF
jgi:hypothetical protein